MVGFTEAGARRIIDITKKGERGLTRTKRRIQRGAIPTEPDFFAVLKSHEGGGKYSWTAVEWTQSGWQENTDYGTGDVAEGNYAQEISGTDQVILGSIEYLRWTEEGYFIFIYNPQMYLGKLVSAGTISGRQGNTPGQGTVTMEQYNPQSGAFEDGDDITVFNNFRTTIEGEGGATLYVQLQWHNGAFWVSAVDCQNTDEEV